jgi:hypothetical protein
MKVALRNSCFLLRKLRGLNWISKGIVAGPEG